MFNFQKSSIFCLLIASVHLVRCTGDCYSVESRFEQFKTLVTKVVWKDPLPKYVTVAYESTDRLHRVSHNIKLGCLREWEIGMEKNCVQFDPEDPSEIVFELAYEAADWVIRQAVEDIKKLIKTKSYLLVWQFDSMLNDGNILQFLAFREQYPKKTAEKEIRKEIKLLQKKYKEMTPAEAKLWYILHNYDRGIIGDHYPEAAQRSRV